MNSSTTASYHHQHQQHQHHQPQHFMANGNNNGINTVSHTINNGNGNANNNNNGGQNVNHMRQTHLTKFAFLLSSARGEGSNEPVVGMHHDVEMAACFSKSHLCGDNNNNNNGMMMMQNAMMTPPSISSSSLSMKSKGAGQQQQQMMNNGCKNSLLEIAAMNMRAPFYTTPDTVSSTAKIVLKNIVSTMEELMDSRLRSTVSQLVKKAGGIANSQLLFRLLSPSRNPIKVATVITRFVLPDNENGENMGSCKQTSISNGDMLSIPLQFKAILDVKVFGEVSTVELSAPVTMLGKFDPQDGLLTAVDVSFDCVNLLQGMIAQARLVVKTAVTKAAALSVQIAEWHTKKKAPGGGSNHHHHHHNSNNMMNSASSTVPSTLSLHSLLGSSISLSSLGSLDNSSLFTAFPSLCGNMNINKAPAASKHGVPGKSLLRESSRGLLRGSRNNSNGMGMNKTNANATFDFGNGNQSNSGNGTLGHRTQSSTSVVRFRMPNTPSPTAPSCAKRVSCSSPESSYSPNTHQKQQLQQQQLVQAQAPVPQQQQQAPEQQNKGNIHAGLFSWLQNDSMFLTDEKIEEQNAADAERERKLREAPMPLAFFTAAQSMGGGECNLEMVSKSIFGGQAQNTNDFDSNCQVKREQEGGECQHDPKRRKVWH